jgi:thymidylate synthase (FAD)
MDEIKCLDHGYVALADVMGDDRTPARTARTSFRNRKERTPDEDNRLTSYLIRHHHNTPLEFIQLRFYMKMPIFVARQFVRHRTQSINEVSYRYVQAAREFYVPELNRMQKKATDNKQGSADEVVDKPNKCALLMRDAGNDAFNTYDVLLAEGLAPELARSVLPVSTYTEWYTQMNMHNFLHMMGLRLDKHAQYEIRVYARAMFDLVKEHFPVITGIWAENNLLEVDS